MTQILLGAMMALLASFLVCLYFLNKRLQSEHVERSKQLVRLADELHKPQQDDTNTSYPECAKMAAVHEKSKAIGDFLEWLECGNADKTKLKRSVFLAAYGIRTTELDMDGQSRDIPEDEWEVTDDLRTFLYQTEALLAKYFDIDLIVVDKEKRAMLEEMKKMGSQNGKA